MASLEMGERRFWIVSPNVNSRNPTVPQWIEASLTHKSVFMGYFPDDLGHAGIGFKFAHSIKEGDVVLIARRRLHNPQVVGFGIVDGNFKTKIPGFSPPGHIGSLRKLDPFIPTRSLPKRLGLLEVLQHTMSLRELKPWRNNEGSICEYLLAELSKNSQLSNPIRSRLRHVEASPSNPQRASHLLRLQSELEYEVRTRAKSVRAQRIETKLVNDYQIWLARQKRILSFEVIGRLRCDAFEKDKNNLIEAKASTRREHIRMALGQLLDYSQLIDGDSNSMNLAILVPRKPDLESLAWLSKHKVYLVWREAGAFSDNRDGWFS